jgi:hypothetical protein
MQQPRRMPWGRPCGSRHPSTPRAVEIEMPRRAALCCADPVNSPTEDEFRALARSAPWLFTTLHFTHRRRDGRGATQAWLSRPGRLRVRLADGREHVQLSTPWNNGRIIRDGREFEDIRPWAQQFNPTWRPDGLVAERPADPRLDADDPIWGSYDWVAMLDPEELSHHTHVTDLATTSREGRETWWAEVAADDGYQPRCGCCPLLWGAISERDEGAAGGPTWIHHHPDVDYPTAWLIGLDRQTGIVVDCTPIGGDRPDSGFIVTIHEVDDPMPDALFVG